MSVILVVDDLAVFREPIAAALRQKGHQTFSAGNGQEALALLRKERVDLMLLDVTMPVMTGIQCLQTLRQIPKFRDLPVILLTAVSERDAVIEAAKLGVRDYLLKSKFSSCLSCVSCYQVRQADPSGGCKR